MDWATRRVLSWRLSNTLDADFCVEALQEALDKFGKPEIFNTDQGAQFMSHAFTGVLKKAGIKISMDGRGRCMDNIFIERLWRSLKYECVYLTEITDGFHAEELIGNWIEFYNHKRPHSSALGGMPPARAYHEGGDDDNNRPAPDLRKVPGHGEMMENMRAIKGPQFPTFPQEQAPGQASNLKNSEWAA